MLESRVGSEATSFWRLAVADCPVERMRVMSEGLVDKAEGFAEKVRGQEVERDWRVAKASIMQFWLVWALSGQICCG